jgi:Na+-driven multidrug efflux pump
MTEEESSSSPPHLIRHQPDLLNEENLIPRISIAEGQELEETEFPIELLDREVQQELDESSLNISMKVLSHKEALCETIKFCTPYMLSKIAISANGMWNGYLYGKLESVALQSEIVTLSYEFLLLGTGMAGLTATSILAGNLNREDNISSVKAIGNVNKTSSIITLGYSLLTIPMFLEAGKIVQAIGLVNNVEITQQVQQYFNGFVWGAIPTLMLYNDEQFSLGIGDTKVPFVFGTFYAGLSSLLAYPLALGEWGAPELGVEGIGFGMAGGAWISWVALRSYFLVKSEYGEFNLYDFKTLKSVSFRKYFEYFLPLSLAHSVDLLTGFINSQFITGVSAEVAAAYSSSSAYFQQLNVAVLGYTSAISALIANVDPRDYNTVAPNSYTVKLQNAQRHISASIISSLGLTTILTVPTLIWPEEFINFFGGNKSEDILHLAKPYLWLNVGNAMLSTLFKAERANLYGLQDIAFPFCVDISTDMLNVLLVSMAAEYANAPTVLVAATIIASFESAVVYSGRLWVVVNRLSNDLAENVVHEEGFFMKNWKRFKSYIFGDDTIEEAFDYDDVGAPFI